MVFPELDDSSNEECSDDEEGTEVSETELQDIKDDEKLCLYSLGGKQYHEMQLEFVDPEYHEVRDSL
jgi:hypothetical protein